MSNTHSITAHLVPFAKQLNRSSVWLTGLWLLQVTAYTLQDTAIDEMLVRVVPLIVFIILGSSCYSLLKRNTAGFFTPLPIFLAWSAVVFGIGPLFRWFSPGTPYRWYTKIFPSDVSSYAGVALLNTTGLLLTLIGTTLTLQLIYSLDSKRLPNPQPGAGVMMHLTDPAVLLTTRNLKKMAFISLFLSATIRIIQFPLGIDLHIPGFLSFVVRFGWLAVFLFGIIGGRNQGLALVLAIATAIMEGTIGLAIGIRTEAVAPLVLLFAGYYVGSRSRKALILGLILVVLALMFVTPVVKTVREMTWGGSYAGNRTEVVIGAVAAQEAGDDMDKGTVYSVWNRLDYSSWQAAMMDLYDRGRPGSTYRYIFWTFVPRFLVPNKPVFAIGHEIGRTVLGVSGSSSFSGTVFGEMYWNGGWFAVALSSLIFGLLLGAITACSLWLFLVKGSVFAFLIGLTGILYGFIVDDTFSVGVVGGGVIFLVLIAVVYWIPGLLSTRRIKVADWKSSSTI